MRANWMIGAMLAMAAAADAEDRKLVIYLQHEEHIGLVNMNFAENTAAHILAEAGVRVHWKTSRPQPADRSTLAVVFDPSAPTDLRPDALAYALPFQEGAAIHVLYRRVLAAGPRQLLPTILGHVLAHEIGHVLRRSDGHANSGVMKAHWSVSDYHAMAVKPYSYTQTDVEMIHDYWTTVRRAATDPIH